MGNTEQIEDLELLEEILLDAEYKLDNSVGPGGDYLAAGSKHVKHDVGVVMQNGFISLRGSIELRLRMTREKLNELRSGTSPA